MSPITLDALAAQPDLIAALTPHEVRALVLRAAAVLAALGAGPAIEPGQAAERDRLLDVHEAARRLGTSARTIWRKRHQEPFASMIRSNGTQRLRFSSAAVADHISRGRVPGQSAPPPPRASWHRSKPATVAQLTALRERGIAFRPSITRGEAADLLERRR